MAARSRPSAVGGAAPTAKPGDDLALGLSTFADELDYVYRTLRRYGVDATDAEDLAQEVFIVAWRRRADFDGTRPLRPWLAGIAFKVAYQHHRRRPPEVADGTVNDVERMPTVELDPETIDARALVLRVLANLPERHRAVLIVHELDGASVDDIAALWGVPRFTLYTRLRRARTAFAREVARLQAVERAAGRGRAAAAALAPVQLLALERPIPAAPAGLRERVMERVHQEATLEAHADLAPAPHRPLAPAPAGARRWPLVAGGMATLGVALVVALRVGGSGAGEERPSSEATAAPGGPRGAGQQQPPQPQITAPQRAPAFTGESAAALPDGLARSLTGFWRFDEAPGSHTAADSSPAGHHCELRELDPARAWVPGAVGGALELGMNGWLECPQPRMPRRTSASVTVAAWVRRAGNLQRHHALVMRSMGERRASYFFFGFDGDLLKVASSGWGGVLQTPVAAPVGRWTHVAFTHASDHIVKLYVDGVEVARRVARRRQFASVEGPLWVGAGLFGANREMGQRFEGAIDELLVYERALSDEEILAVVSLGRRGKPTAPRPGETAPP